MPIHDPDRLPGIAEVPLAFDMHTHLYSNLLGDRPMQPEEYLSVMDEAGIERTIMATFDGLMRDPVAENDRLVEWTSAAGDRLLPYCSVDFTEKSVRDELRRSVLELGCVGVKVHGWLQRAPVSHALMAELARECVTLDVPVMFHDGTPPDTTPLQVGWLASEFPELTVILGHGGLFELWPDAIAAAQRSPNCLICMCGTAPVAIFEAIVAQVPTSQILIGTDGGFGTMWREMILFRMEEFRSLEISDADRHAIFRGNAHRVLGLTDINDEYS